MRIIFKKMTFAGIALFGFAGVGFAQPTPAQIHMQQQQQNQNMGRMIQSDNMRRCGNPNGCAQGGSAGPSAAEVRAWHARERKIQAEIAQLRATPFYQAIAYDFANNLLLGGGGYYTEQRAVEQALKKCKSSNCHLISTFANACGVIVTPDKGIRTAEDFFVGVDVDDRKAAAKAMQTCEARFGKNQCGYSSVKTKHGTAFCTGYDYSIYGQK